MEELYNQLPTEIPQSLCHGDFTLENILYSNGKFYLLDAVTGPYDSWIFDIAKMRQDIDAHWFLRNSNIELTVQLKILRDRLEFEFNQAFNKYFYILMLLRVYRHCIEGTKEHQLILTEIKKIWK
jgi:tRNA A-37 threonylcarbamoyl transferase component Bud32